MLATNDKTAPILSYLNNESLQYFSNTYWSNSDLSKRHLYFISNEKIKEGDWYLNIVSNETVNVDFNIDYEQNHCKKIIATTDTSLGLPQPSKSFIQAFIAAYNEGKSITKVLVEMEGIGRMKSGGEFTPITSQLKVNSSNEITIKKVKDSWNREEVIELLSNHFIQAGSKIGLGQDVTKFTKTWIEENL